MHFPKEEKAKYKKRIIVDALMRRLENDVYSKITLQDIADEAGFSKGGVLHYFQTKEEIFLELISQLFGDLARIHNDLFQMTEKSGSVVPLSALLGVESFILNKTNIRIVANLVLYAFEEEKIMAEIRKFITRHFEFYRNVISLSERDTPLRRKTDLSPKYMSRIAQTIMLFIGILEAIEPIDIDHYEIMKYVSSLLNE